ncbi:hypothetical protein [Isoptericola croceus]|uniref:hypothetical protein n=1 Tax=Isoptericola croceus TaxID=3031406 RepID=UPI0023F8B3AF|nr:hypothetical protein [Isoptericola croceus]
MGIRYYASTWHPDDAETVIREPRLALPDDPFFAAWSRLSAPEASPNLLYLDKAWPDFQDLTGPRRGRAARPSYRLFEGQIAHVKRGWIPWLRALEPTEVRTLSQDLAAITNRDIEQCAASDDGKTSGYLRYRHEDLTHFLDQAQAFISQAADRGDGIAYMIG